MQYVGSWEKKCIFYGRANLRRIDVSREIFQYRSRISVSGYHTDKGVVNKFLFMYENKMDLFYCVGCNES